MNSWGKQEYCECGFPARSNGLCVNCYAKQQQRNKTKRLKNE